MAMLLCECKYKAEALSHLEGGQQSLERIQANLDLVNAKLHYAYWLDGGIRVILIFEMDNDDVRDGKHEGLPMAVYGSGAFELCTVKRLMDADELGKIKSDLSQAASFKTPGS